MTDQTVEWWHPVLGKMVTGRTIRLFSQGEALEEAQGGKSVTEPVDSDSIVGTYTNQKGEEWKIVSGSLWLALKSGAGEGMTLTLNSENCERALAQVPRPEEI